MRGRSLLEGLALLTLTTACGGGSDTPAGPSGGAANAVTVGNNFYSPADLSVPLNTTVTWTWADGATTHSVTFDDGGASSQQQSSGTFQRAFATAGTFTYFCTVHGAAVMHGSVTVGSTTGGGGGGGGGGSGGY
jgi:plastocyanin